MNANGEQTINFNICENSHNECKDDDGDDIYDFANLKGLGTCTSLTTDEHNDAEASFFNAKEPEEGLTLVYRSEDKCSDNDFYTFTIDVKCNEKVENPAPKLILESVTENSCHARVQFEAKAGMLLFLVDFIYRVHNQAIQFCWAEVLRKFCLHCIDIFCYWSIPNFCGRQIYVDDFVFRWISCNIWRFACKSSNK